MIDELLTNIIWLLFWIVAIIVISLFLSAIKVEEFLVEAALYVADQVEN